MDETEQTYVRRLRRLISVLENVQEQGIPFDMTQWAGEAEHEPCGSACCAAGYAAFDPEFQTEGFHLLVYWAHREGGTPVATIADLNDLVRNRATFSPAYEGRIDYSATRRFFGPETDEIFDPDHYVHFSNIPVEDVIARIKEHLEEHYGEHPDGD